MSNPDDLKSIFEDPSDIEMADLPKHNWTLQLKQSLQSLKSIDQPFNVTVPPSWHSLLFLSLHPWHPLWFPNLHWMIITNHSYYSYWTHSFLQSMTPETISFGRGHHDSREGNMLSQGRSKRSNPTTGSLASDYTGASSQPKVNQSLVIDPTLRCF